MAAERAKILIGCYRITEANDPVVYGCAVVDVFMHYPPAVAIAVSDPATGLPARLKWLPAIAEIVDACEQAVAPLRREYQRLRDEESLRRALPPPPAAPRPTREQIDAVLAKAGLRKMPEARVDRPTDGGHAKRALDDLAARKRGT